MKDAYTLEMSIEPREPLFDLTTAEKSVSCTKGMVKRLLTSHERSVQHTLEV